MDETKNDCGSCAPAGDEATEEVKTEGEGGEETAEEEKTEDNA